MNLPPTFHWELFGDEVKPHTFETQSIDGPAVLNVPWVCKQIAGLHGLEPGQVKIIQIEGWKVGEEVAVIAMMEPFSSIRLGSLRLVVRGEQVREELAKW